jgi:tetratricopeptide (TPR) repeat protein
MRVTTGGAGPFAGLPAEVIEVMAGAPVQEKVLAEFGVAWSGLSEPQARMAETLRVFLVTWDPLEHHLPRPVAFATVNASPPGLEVVVYIPVWVLIAAAGREERVADVVGELGGSAVVVAAANEEAVVSGRYPAQASRGSVPQLLDQRPAGAGLGTFELTLVSEGWEPIGLAAIGDVVQDALGPVDLDRSPVELAASAEPAAGCPACQARRFGFPAELGEAAPAMCPAHRAEADRVSTERFERARTSNPDGWGAVLDACRRLELPHLPNGLATRMAGAEDLMFEVREPDELAAVVQDLVEAARWFPGRAEDLALALGAEEDMPWLPEWMENIVFELGRAGLAAEAAQAADALIRIDPDNESTYGADLGCALAEAGDAPAARARIDANLARWPDEPWVRVHAGDALRELGDADGAEAHFLAALEMAEEADDFELRSDVFDRLAELGRAPGPRTAIRQAGPGGGRRRSRSARLGRNDPCFCGSGRKYKHCHGQQA